MGENRFCRGLRELHGPHQELQLLITGILRVLPRWRIDHNLVLCGPHAGNHTVFIAFGAEAFKHGLDFRNNTVHHVLSMATTDLYMALDPPDTSVGTNAAKVHGGEIQRSVTHFRVLENEPPKHQIRISIIQLANLDRIMIIAKKKRDILVRRKQGSSCRWSLAWSDHKCLSSNPKRLAPSNGHRFLQPSFERAPNHRKITDASVGRTCHRPYDSAVPIDLDAMIIVRDPMNQIVDQEPCWQLAHILRRRAGMLANLAKRPMSCRPRRVIDSEHQDSLTSHRFGASGDR